MLWFHLLLLIVKPPSGFRLSNHMKKKEMENMTWSKAFSSSGRNNILEYYYIILYNIMCDITTAARAQPESRLFCTL